ncbi:MAG: peptidoglycan DD-metalloendopeptidase family protein [Gammaproteobacteria bacterium]|nr:peptidoglycan DD-metalloendopeptidase family protein [Gammaproteobacteria bacterium]
MLIGGLGVVFIVAGLLPSSDDGSASATSRELRPLELPPAGGGAATPPPARELADGGDGNPGAPPAPSVAERAPQLVATLRESIRTSAESPPAARGTDEATGEQDEGQTPAADAGADPRPAPPPERAPVEAVLAPSEPPVAEPATQTETVAAEPAAETVPAGKTGDDEVPAPTLREQAFTVTRGDSLYGLFKLEGLSTSDLAAMLALGDETAAFRQLRPGDRLTVLSDDDGRVHELLYLPSRGDAVQITRGDRGFTARTVSPEELVPEPSAESTDAPSPSTLDGVAPVNALAEVLDTHSFTVTTGDSLYSIFKSNGFELADLAALLESENDGHRLRSLLPGQTLEFHLTPERRVAKLVHYLDETDSQRFTRVGDAFRSELMHEPLERRTAVAVGEIDSSLFIAAQEAGLSDNVIMQMVEILAWDVDFALDIRRGDRFAVIYEELYKDGEKVRDGAILATEFVNQGHRTRAVRFVYPDDGHVAYFTPDGHNVRKAFLRTPVKFSRISSRFSTRRKHPVLHKLRAHRGVDYAAPVGTPIKASGDGKVVFIGWKGGYGKAVVLQHGAMYSTLYAHMSRFAAKLRQGQRVRQGQVIGYVGSTGLATGSHLHYEFRVRGVHRDPLRVELPKAAPIDDEYRAEFQHATKGLVDRLELLSGTQLAAENQTRGSGD